MIFRIIHKKITFFFFIITLSISSISYAAESIITRTEFKNTSDQPWTVQFTILSGFHLVDVGDLGCSETQVCTIGPRSSKLVVYKTTSGDIKGILTATDYKGINKSFDIDGDAWPHPNLFWLTSMDNNCPHDISINMTFGEDGKTGKVYDNAGAGIIFNYPNLCWPGNL